MRHLSDIKPVRSTFRRVSLLGMAIAFAVGSYAALIPHSVKAAECGDPAQGTGTATSALTIPSDGTYRVWSKFMATPTSDSLHVAIDDQCLQLGNTPLAANQWTWVGHQNGDTSAKATVALTAGTHTLKLIGSEAGVKVGRALLLKDTDCIPAENGENCTTTPSSSDTQAPTAPTALRTTVTSNKLVSVSWAPSQDNVSVTGYDVYRNAAKVATVNEAAFHDSNLVASTSYTYYIIARDAAGNASAPSAVVTATTLAKAPQGKGKLYGKVTFPPASASVATVSFVVNGAVKASPSDANGYYYITDIPAGTYLMKFQAGNSMKFFEIKIKSSGDTIKDVTLPLATAQPPAPTTPIYATVTLAGATLGGGATLVTEDDGSKSVLLNSTSNPDPDPTPGDGRNCIVKPSACGYPDATNTGYKPTGVEPTTNGVTINHEGDFIVTEPGAVIDSKRIDGCVHIKAPNVTIKRSLITNCQSYFNIRVFPEGGNFTLEDSEVDGNNVDGQNAALVDDSDGPLTVRRMYMHNVSDGPHPGAHWLIEDSYITDLYACSICHNDTIQSAGALDVTLRHNTIVNTPEDNPSGEGGKNAVVRIATEQGPVNGFVIENNLLSGGNFAVQIRSQGSGYPQGVKITNNRIVPNWRFGPYDVGPSEDYVAGAVQFSGNYRDDTGEALNTP